MYTKKPKEMGSLLMMCGVVYCLKTDSQYDAWTMQHKDVTLVHKGVVSMLAS